jgi:ATP-dependent Clp protease ATP-binding subunit ClpB
VFNILLQVLDDGRLTDGQGRTVSFRNAIVVMTSNVASPAIMELSERGDMRAMNAAVEETLRATFRPEFLNRIDETVVFAPLTIEEVGEIALIQLEKVRLRLAERKIDLKLTPAAVERIALDGFDPAFGARPLKRVVQREVVDGVAKAMIEGRIREGSEVVVDVGDDGELVVT